MTQEQIYYLREVLGIRGVILPQRRQGVEPHLEENLDTFVDHTLSIDSDAKDSKRTRPLSLRTNGHLETARLVVLVAGAQKGQLLVGDLQDLAIKMIQAMKLDPIKDIYWLEWMEMGASNFHREGSSVSIGCDEISEIQLLLASCHLPLLVFGQDTLSALIGKDEKLGEWVEWQNLRLMATHRLEDLISKQDLKRSSWAHLQKMMRAL